MSEMSYRRLGTSGLVVSVVGIGCNNFGRKLDADHVQVHRFAAACAVGHGDG